MSADDDDRPLLVFVNPFSGTGRSLRLFHEQLKPWLEREKIPFQLVVTEFAGHAREFVRSRQQLQHLYRGLVAISGDGLVHELINGLRERLDWDQLVAKMPIGLVPGGSGCALNCSVLRHCQGPQSTGLNPGASVQNVVMGAKSGNSTPLDLIEVETCDGKKHLSFLGVTIGVIADGDIGTEWLRWMGFARTYLYIAWRTIFPAPYKARVSYLPLKRDDTTGKVIPVSPSEPLLSLPPLSEPASSEWVVETDFFHVVYGLNLSMLDPWTLFAPESSPGDGILNLVFVRGSITRAQLISWFISLEKGPDFGSNPSLDIVPVRAFRIEPLDECEGILSLDAERALFGPVQGQIIPQKANIMVQ